MKRPFPRYGSIWLRVKEIILKEDPTTAYIPSECLDEPTYPVLEASVLYQTPNNLPQFEWTWNHMLPYITRNEREWIRSISSGINQTHHLELMYPSVMLLHGSRQHGGHFNKVMPNGITYLLSKIRANELRPVTNIPNIQRKVTISSSDARLLLMRKKQTVMPLAS
jgi:hypothetical protein